MEKSFISSWPDYLSNLLPTAICRQAGIHYSVPICPAEGISKALGIFVIISQDMHKIYKTFAILHG